MRKSVHSAGQRVLCDLLRAARRKARLTQQKLAQKLAKPQSFVAKYEKGERRLDVVEFVQVVRSRHRRGSRPPHEGAAPAHVSPTDTAG